MFVCLFVFNTFYKHVIVSECNNSGIWIFNREIVLNCILHILKCICYWCTLKMIANSALKYNFEYKWKYRFSVWLYLLSRDESDLCQHHAGGITEGLFLQSCDQKRHCGGSGSCYHLPQCQPDPHLPQTSGLLLLPTGNAFIQSDL